MSFYLGQIELFAFNFAPAGWAPCNGQIMPIMQNQALFSLIATTYGGNGETTFALPNMHPVSPSGPHYFIFINAQAATFPQRH
jgi:microcystin-dependent protein